MSTIPTEPAVRLDLGYEQIQLALLMIYSLGDDAGLNLEILDLTAVLETLDKIKERHPDFDLNRVKP